MKVELFDFTGACYPEPANYAASILIYAKETRLEQTVGNFVDLLAEPLAAKLEKLDYIAKTIKSSWEFVDYTFQITDVTRAFTHQFVRTRTASYAQQSQRSVNMKGFGAIVPESIRGNAEALAKWDRAIAGISNTYDDFQDMGIPTQDARGILPTNVSTNIIVKMNLRTLSNIIGKRVNPRAQGEYTAVASLMAEEAMKVHPWVRSFLFPEKHKTPALAALLARVLAGRTPANVPEVNAVMKEIDALKGVW